MSESIEKKFVDFINKINDNKHTINNDDEVKKIKDKFDTFFDTNKKLFNLQLFTINFLSNSEQKNVKETDNDSLSYEFEPEEDEILEDLLPKNISTQVFKAFLENAASEQGSRMTAMDNATRNAGDLVDKLTITYNRSRQASITKELIEIISGAESL